MGLLHRAHNRDQWAINTRAAGSEFICTVLWKRTQGGQLDEITAFISTREIHDPCAGASPAASRFRQTTSFGTELGLDLGEGHRLKCLKQSRVLQELLPGEILYPTSLLETFYPALQTER